VQTIKIEAGEGVVRLFIAKRHVANGKPAFLSNDGKNGTKLQV